MANIGAILGGAFGVIRHRPGAVAAWAVTYIVGMIALFALIGLCFASFDARAGGGPPEFSGFLIVVVLIFLFGYVLLTVVLMNAVFRAVLRPQEHSYASLRLGMDEWRMVGLQIIVWIAWIVLGFIMQLVLGMLTQLLIAAAGGIPQVAGALTIALGLAYVAALTWLSVRVSLLYPMTFFRRSIVIDEAWDIGRGSFWAVFIPYLVVIAPIVILYLVTFARLFWALGQPDPDMASLEWMQSWQAGGWAVGILLALLWIGVLIFTAVMGPAAMASAAKELMIARGDYSDQDVGRTAEIFA